MVDTGNLEVQNSEVESFFWWRFESYQVGNLNLLGKVEVKVEIFERSLARFAWNLCLKPKLLSMIYND